MALAEAAQQTALAEYLRQSLWLYPIINTGHILGIAFLVVATVSQDLRLLGCWSSISLHTFLKITRPLSYCGLGFAFIFGLLLCITQAQDYLASNVFLAKLFCISLALVNAAILLRSDSWKNALSNNDWGTNIRFHACVSLLLWLAVVFLGRFVGYR